MKEMVYSGNNKTELLYFELVQGSFGEWGALIVINCRGSHPCAYVQCPSIQSITDDNDVCLDSADRPHGGFTFLGTLSHLGLGDKIWLGWDYAHLGDWCQSMPVEADLFDHDRRDKKWTTEEVASEARIVLEEILDGNYTVYDK